MHLSLVPLPSLGTSGSRNKPCRPTRTAGWPAVGTPTRRQHRRGNSGGQNQGFGGGEEGQGCGGEQEGQVDASTLMNAYGYAHAPSLVRASPRHSCFITPLPDSSRRRSLHRYPARYDTRRPRMQGGARRPGRGARVVAQSCFLAAQTQCLNVKFLPTVHVSGDEERR